MAIVALCTNQHCILAREEKIAALRAECERYREALREMRDASHSHCEAMAKGEMLPRVSVWWFGDRARAALAEPAAAAEAEKKPLSPEKFDELWEATTAWREYYEKRRRTDPSYDHTFWWNPGEHATVEDALIDWHAKQKKPATGGEGE